MNRNFLTPKQVGLIIIALVVLMSFILYSYTKNIIALNMELHKNCPLPEGVCPYKRSIPVETSYGIGIVAVLGLLGIYLIFSEEQLARIRLKESKKTKEAVKNLQNEEKKIFEIIRDSDGYIFQSDLITKSGFSKVKVSRILDKLETKGLVEKRRRGMSNIVILKEF